jgi:hypothetical protein
MPFKQVLSRLMLRSEHFFLPRLSMSVSLSKRLVHGDKHVKREADPASARWYG